uniref:Kinesin motor domain-containing protein n=1 Tax=Salix viminalis TaxID=40686 RepID=A0A6N2KRS8_SALVM
MEQHKEREFVLKFSAMEIYNEAVRDLLSTSSSPLRLLDDPERGTVVEGLIEDTVVDWNHLQELISICEAQRQIGENTLNETSSRSHQILRLQGRNGHVLTETQVNTHTCQDGHHLYFEPCRSHVEQSRNTLLFASCAKEVTTNAQVNLVMSDKTLVKKLQKEVARLESWEDIGKRNSEDAKDIGEEVRGMNVKKEADVLFPVLEEKIAMHEGEVPSSQEEDKELIHINSNNTHETVKQKIQELHETINHLERSPSLSEAIESSYKNLKWSRSQK